MKKALLCIGSLLTTVALNLPATAQTTQRGQSWEANIGAIYTGSESSDGAMGSSLDVDSEIGITFGLQYNFNERLALGFDGAYVRPDYTAVYNTEEDGLQKLSHTMTVFSGQFNGTWNILQGPFTPYLQVGLGWTSIDSNVADGPPNTGCWWDPWWGYICSNFYSTYNSSDFSYGIGAGLRYEFRNNMFIKGSVNRVEIDSDSSADPKFDSFKLELGWMF